MMTTMSSTSRFRCCCCHFSLSLRLEVTSFIQRRQNCSAYACATRPFCFADRSFFGENIRREIWAGLAEKQMISVKHLGSDGSSLIGVRLRLLRIFSTRVSAEVVSRRLTVGCLRQRWALFSWSHHLTPNSSEMWSRRGNEILFSLVGYQVSDLSQEKLCSPSLLGRLQ
jgi:hypothetical protein